jgi:hypothetical protein
VLYLNARNNKRYMIATHIDRKTSVPRKNVVPVVGYVKPDLKEELEKWAESEQRTLSSLAAYILTKALEDHQKQSGAR